MPCHEVNIIKLKTSKYPTTLKYVCCLYMKCVNWSYTNQINVSLVILGLVTSCIL